MRKFSAVERDLETLRQNGKKVYESYNKENESRKRTKDTSGDVVEVGDSARGAFCLEFFRAKLLSE